MPRCERPSLFLLLLLTLPAAGHAAPVAHVASTTVVLPLPAPAPAEPPPAAIRITPRLDAAGRDAWLHGEENRQAALRPAVTRWCQTYPATAHPLYTALDEALDSLDRGWGPASRGLGFPVHAALLPLALLLPVPDPLLDHQLRQALFDLEEGAHACGKGMSMTALLRLGQGRKGLAGLDRALAAYSPACVPQGPGESFTLLVGRESAGPDLPGNRGEQGEPSSAKGSPAGIKAEAKGSEKARTPRAPRSPKKPRSQSHPGRP
jgi:hypothetical protein